MLISVRQPQINKNFKLQKQGSITLDPFQFPIEISLLFGRHRYAVHLIVNGVMCVRKGPSINYVVSVGVGGQKLRILHSKKTTKMGDGFKNCQF